MVVRALESSGSLASSVTVTWSALKGGGALSAIGNTTDSSGADSVAFTPESTASDIVAAQVASVTAPIDFAMPATLAPDSAAAGN